MKEEVFVTEITVDECDQGKRLDLFLSSLVEGYSRSRIQNAIENAMVRVNGQAVKQNYKVKESDFVTLFQESPMEVEPLPENIPLEILHEDGDIIVVNKPRGMVVHPAPGNFSGTLVNALLYHCKDLSGINGPMRPGIVHRIDKDTSGILVAAKNDFAHRGLAVQLREHHTRREYLALVHGNPIHNAGTIDAPIGRSPGDRKKMAVSFEHSKFAVTHFDVIEHFAGYSLVKLRLETGRTHQIRVHMAYIQHPITGDPKYGPGKNDFGLKGQALCAYLLGFKHPRTKEYLEFSVGLPDYFVEILSTLGSVKGVEFNGRLESALHSKQPDGGRNTQELS